MRVALIHAFIIIAHKNCVQFVGIIIAVLIDERSPSCVKHIVVFSYLVAPVTNAIETRFDEN